MVVLVEVLVTDGVVGGVVGPVGGRVVIVVEVVESTQVLQVPGHWVCT